MKTRGGGNGVQYAGTWAGAADMMVPERDAQCGATDLDCVKPTDPIDIQLEFPADSGVHYTDVQSVQYHKGSTVLALTKDGYKQRMVVRAHVKWGVITGGYQYPMDVTLKDGRVFRVVATFSNE